jgi:hypothetical protein
MKHEITNNRTAIAAPGHLEIPGEIIDDGSTLRFGQNLPERNNGPAVKKGCFLLSFVVLCYGLA